MSKSLKKLAVNVIGYGGLAIVGFLAGVGIAWIEESIDEE